MLKSTKLIVAGVMVCFAIMAINSNIVLASDLYVDFGSSGLFKFNGDTWERISTGNAEGLAASNGNNLAADFGTSGLYEYDGTWSRISTGDVDEDGGIIGIGPDLYVDFASLGLWHYDGVSFTWTRISTGNAQGLSSNGNKLVADFGTSGLYEYDGAWTRISSGDADDMVYMYNSVPKTGQTTKYADGDDGDLQKGVAWPDPRFTDNGDGTITDNLTGLIWLKNANCFEGRSWANAISDANGLADGDCGLTDGSSPGDWRLPNVRELQSLVDYGRYNPALPSGHPFTNVQSSVYWSSTTTASNTSSAWHVYFGAGFVLYDHKDNFYCYVWCVRGGN